MQGRRAVLEPGSYLVHAHVRDAARLVVPDGSEDGILAAVIADAVLNGGKKLCYAPISAFTREDQSSVTAAVLLLCIRGQCLHDGIYVSDLTRPEPLQIVLDLHLCASFIFCVRHLFLFWRNFQKPIPRPLWTFH
eukprot:XP_001705791.1 Hypothetical protein GL50803_20167 [Giardia lamblia ATCC 50803]